MGDSVGRVEAIENFAQSIIGYEPDEKGRESRRMLLSDMFDGNMDVLGDQFSFEEMFKAFDEHVLSRNAGNIVDAISKNMISAKSKRRVFW